MTASATSFMAASWLNEPGSPWMAIFIPVPTPPVVVCELDVANGACADCFLAPYHRSTADLREIASNDMGLPLQPNVGGDECKKDHGDNTVHSEEGGVEPT